MAKFIEIEKHSDVRGTLAVIQNSAFFDIERIYYIFGASGVRGGHRHIETRQIAICVSGSCTIRVFDKLENREVLFDLGEPHMALVIEPEDFHWMEGFSSDCVLLVLANKKYNKSDYVYEK